MSDAGWRALAEKALAGRSIESLATLTPEGLRLEPLYPRDQTRPPHAMRESDAPWAIAGRVDHPNPAEANRLALIDLEGGADALTLVFAGETARGYGLPLTGEALAVALDGVELDLIAVRLEAGTRASDAARLLGELTTARRLGSAGLAVDLGLDPLGSFARTGAPAPVARGDDLRAFREPARRAGLAGRVFLADGRPYHEAGAGEAEELAAVLGTGVAYLRQLEETGAGLAEASADIAFLLAADAETYLSIAKFRALRRLWARVEEACGLAPRPARVHAETSWRMMTRRDPWTNVMRATAAAFAAGVGGADSIAVHPFTAALGLPGEAARRLARNTQIILQSEAHLAAVDDPAAGSGGLEAATEALCTRAWTLFQQLEAEGGIAASLRSGALRARIAKTAARRARAIATVERGITGTSSFPSLTALPVALLAAERRPEIARASLAFPSVRDAEPFEALRDRADAAAVGGAPPEVFLATLGQPASYGARATYAVNFLAAAGIRTVIGDVDEFHRASPSAVCLCGSDRNYADHLDQAVARLRAAGARHVMVAGFQSPALDRTKAADTFIHHGCNAVQVLEDLLNVLLTVHPAAP